MLIDNFVHNQKKFIILKLFIFFSIYVLFSVKAVASDTQKIHVLHSIWEDHLVIKNSKLCRSNKDCGFVELLTDNQIKIKWDKYKPEVFKLNKKNNIWVLDSNYAIQSEYEEFVYTFEEPYIKVNPYGKTPLSALIKFPTQESVKILIRIKGKDGSPDIVNEFEGYRKEHEIPVFGLYPNYDNQVTLKATNKKGHSKEINLVISTKKLKLHEQWFMIQKKDNDFYYYATYRGIVYDEYGNIRYQFIVNNADFLYFYKDYVFVEDTKKITKYSLLGEIIQVYHYPKDFYGYMHGIGFKDNDNLLVFGSFKDSKALIEGRHEVTHRDFILEFNAQTGAVLAKYDLADMLNPDRTLIVKSSNKEENKIDWAHTNGIDYDAKNKAIVISGRHFGIAKIDEKTKKPIWWMTPHQLTHKSGRNGDKGDISHLLLTAIDENAKPYSEKVQKGLEKANGFKWPLKSHSVKYVGNGVYSIFDNSGEMYDKKLYTTQNSYASVFKIDDRKKTVQQLFLKDLKEYSELGSSVVYNPQSKQLLVTVSRVYSPNGEFLFNTHIYRFNKNGEILYKAMLHKDIPEWEFLIQPFEFYSENNWPTPSE